MSDGTKWIFSEALWELVEGAEQAGSDQVCWRKSPEEVERGVNWRKAWGLDCRCRKETEVRTRHVECCDGSGTLFRGAQWGVMEWSR